MKKTKNTNLIVIENGQLSTYLLDDKLEWEVGRPTKENTPDIKLYLSTVSRKHGRFQNMDGIWFYLDYHGKNGTVLNDRHLEAGVRGRIKPVMLKNGDIFVFGGSREAVINSKTIWARFSTEYFGECWNVVDTQGAGILHFAVRGEVIILERPSNGTVIDREEGMAIYMGELTYLIGEISLVSI